MKQLLYGFVLVFIFLLNSSAVSAGWGDDEEDFEDHFQNFKNSFNDDDFDDLL